MSWFTLTILTIIFWGVGQVLIKRGFAHLSPWQTYAVDTFFTLFLWIPYGIIAGFNIEKIDFISLITVIFLGITFAGYYYVVEKAPISTVTPIFSSAPAGTLLISLGFFGETLNPLQIFAVILTIIGVISLTLPTRLVKPNPIVQTWIFWAIFLTVIFSFEPLLFKLVISRTGNGTFMLLLSFGQVIAVLLWHLVRPAKSVIPKIPKKYFLWTILGVILFNIGTITDALALERGLASLVAPLANLNVAVIIILSVVFLKEKINLTKVFAVILILIGVIIITSQLESYKQSINPVNSNIINPPVPSSIIPTKTVLIYADETILKWETARVKHVFDGDTVELTDGRRVRLIGIDSPEVAHENQKEQCFARQAKDVTVELLSQQEIGMEKDVSDTDKYGRLLRYIYSDGVFINEFLIRQGFAKALNIPPDTKYSSEFKIAELEAKDNLRGLWKSCESTVDL